MEEAAEMVERRYWMLEGVLTMVVVKTEDLRWIKLASSRKGMRWPWAMKGSIRMWWSLELGSEPIFSGGRRDSVLVRRKTEM